MSFLDGFEKIARQNEPLAMHTWFQLGGPAEYFAEPETPEQLLALLRRCHETGTAVRVLGGGSNLLVRDEGVHGLVIHLCQAEFQKVHVEGSTVTAGGGALLSRTVTSAVHQGLGGIESLVGVPGTVGGALHGNAGAHGNDVGQCVHSADVVSVAGETYTRSREEMVFAYRRSNLDELVILEARFELERDDPADLARRMQKHWIVRKSSQPMGHQSAGCVFRNPRGVSAGELIDSAGLKGTRIGGAVVSERHAGFILAEPECTSQDVLRLIELVRGQVHERTGVTLELEIEIW